MSRLRIGGSLALVLAGLAGLQAAEKEIAIGGGSMTASAPVVSTRVGAVGGAGYRTLLSQGEARVTLVVVAGTPYEMGWHLGNLTRDEITALIPPTVEGVRQRFELTESQLEAIWSTLAAYTDDRLEQELLGLAEGSGVPLRTLQAAHCLPILMPYSCSSIAAWDEATRDGHLYQTRDLDWDLELGAHEFPVVVLFLPAEGVPHVTPGFAGFLGAHCGMNAAGLVLSEMGDSPAREMPYELHAPHFTSWFRSLLYDAESLTEALTTFHSLPMTKRYHFVFGDGQTDKRAVKIRAHSPEPPADRVRVWRDNDPEDELAPNVLPHIVYQDEGRGAFPTLKAKSGSLDARAMIGLCNQIPIEGGNVMNVVFDGTAFRLWLAYASGQKEAYKRPYIAIDLRALDGDADGRPDLVEGAQDSDADGVLDLVEP